MTSLKPYYAPGLKMPPYNKWELDAIWITLSQYLEGLNRAGHNPLAILHTLEYAFQLSQKIAEKHIQDFDTYQKFLEYIKDDSKRVIGTVLGA